MMTIVPRPRPARSMFCPWLALIVWAGGQVTNAGDHIYMVVNGACKYGDMEHLKEQMADYKGDVHMDYLETQQLLALQGKGAPAALQVGTYPQRG